MTTKIQRFVCPEVGLPATLQRNNNERKLDGSSSLSASSSSSGRPDNRKRKAGDLYDDMDLTNKEEVRNFMRTIKEFNANSELGSSRRNYKEDILTQLGAPPPKQQKMPFKLRLKLDDARKKREERKLDELRQSDEVTAVHKTLLQKAQKRREKRKARK